MNEIEEDDDCDELDEADESVDIYKSSVFLGNDSSDQFLTGAINWQQEAIEQRNCEDTDENENIRCDDDLISGGASNRNDNSDYSLNNHDEAEDSQSPFRSNIEDDSNNSLN